MSIFSGEESTVKAGDRIVFKCQPGGSTLTYTRDGIPVYNSIGDDKTSADFLETKTDFLHFMISFSTMLGFGLEVIDDSQENKMVVELK